LFTFREHTSYSALNQYLRCPLQYYFERILKLPRPTQGSGLVLGSAIHAALADYHLGLQHRQPISIDDVRKIFVAAWSAREVERRVQYRAGEARADLIATGVSLLETYIRGPEPQGIVAVERPMLVPLSNSRGEYLEKPLATVLDLLTRDEQGLTIHEFKTSGRAYSESEVALSLQPACYANAVLQKHGEWARIEYAILIKTKAPRLQRLPTSRTQQDIERLGDIVENVERAVAQKTFFPIETPLNCSGCPYRQPCREWNPERPAPGGQLVSLNGHARC
jgi:putative RecB family exonuclease